MSDYIDARARYRSARTTTVASHKYDVGSLVAHKPGAAAERGTFRVTRHLPDGGQGLQVPASAPNATDWSAWWSKPPSNARCPHS